MCVYTILQHLGSSTTTIESLLNGTHEYSSKLMAAKRPMVVVGTEALANEQGRSVFSLAQQLSAKLSSSLEDSEWPVYNTLHQVRVVCVVQKYMSC